jgi:hypothetical protein
MENTRTVNRIPRNPGLSPRCQARSLNFLASRKLAVFMAQSFPDRISSDLPPLRASHPP